MLSPKRLKFRKQHKGRIHGLTKGGAELSFGTYGLKALTPGIALRPARLKRPVARLPVK